MESEKQAKRSDSWRPENDATLSEIVLRNIREGRSQLDAFIECAEILGRTSAACGFRWNGVVRKLYKNEIAEAKEKRKERLSRRSRTRHAVQTTNGGETLIHTIIRSVKNHEVNYLNLLEHVNQLEKRVNELESELLTRAEVKMGKPLPLDEFITILNRAKQLLEYEKQVKDYPFNPEEYQDMA